jgi:HEAT repeat protein
MRADTDRHLAALTSWDSDDDLFAAVIGFIAEVGPESALSAAQEWLASGDVEAAEVGLDVLGALAERDAALWPVVLEQAERFAENGEAHVRLSAALALGWKADSRALELWLRFARDESADVRQRAMAVLPSQFDQEMPDARVVSALLAGLEDAEPDVRDWAAMALGLVAVDTTEVREALLRHLDDDGANTAGEAAVSLAILGDERVLPVLREWLVREDVGDLWVEAAGELGDPQLLPLLEQLREEGWEADEDVTRPHVLAVAIERCRSGLSRDE